MIRPWVYQAFAIEKKNEAAQLKAQILSVCQAKKIFLLGQIVSEKRSETIFAKEDVAKAFTEQYFLLVLVDKTRAATLSQVQDKIENHLQPFAAVTAIVIYADDFVQWLHEGHVFANQVYEKGLLLYEDEQVPLPFPKAVDENEVKRKNEVLHMQTSLRAASFLAGAELYMVRKEYKMAVFMLHQAAEQVLRGMLMMETGLRVVSHNIEKMLRYCGMFNVEMCQVYCRHHEKEKRLLKMLNDAYLDARYKEDSYTAGREDVELIFRKTSRMMEILRAARDKT